MDVLYGTDQKLGDMEESDMTDFLDADMFSSSLTHDNYMDNDWLNCFFDDPVLNDKMITDAAQPPCIKSEHSYSLNDNAPGSPLGLGTKIGDIDVDFLGHNALNLTQKPFTGEDNQADVKQESLEIDPLLTSISKTSALSSSSTNKKPTIILATSSSMMFQSHSDQPVFPSITVKQEPPDTYEIMDQSVSVEQIVLPPTPPSSASSDSDGSLSPGRSSPSSPIHIQSSRHHLGSKSCIQPIFVNPLPQSGVLLLSEEEKRTLVSEGYPVPSKLPLTKQEEKNLKKIRRKIKNKISAQESRRKKKEYLEALEKRVESYNQENCDLKKKVDSLENNNRSLLGQLHKLQSLVSKMPRPSAPSATQTGSVLMVLVFCFAVFLGSWSPTSLNIGYSSGSRGMTPVFMSKPEYIRPAPDYGPSVANAKVHDDYATPNMKSRMLLSLKDDLDEGLNDDVRTFYPWDRSWCSSEPRRTEDDEHVSTNKPAINDAAPFSVDGNRDDENKLPVLPRSSTKGVARTNETDDYQAIMHPDISTAQIEFRTMEQRGNFSVEIETA